MDYSKLNLGSGTYGWLPDELQNYLSQWGIGQTKPFKMPETGGLEPMPEYLKSPGSGSGGPNTGFGMPIDYTDFNSGTRIGMNPTAPNGPSGVGIKVPPRAPEVFTLPPSLPSYGGGGSPVQQVLSQINSYNPSGPTMSTGQGLNGPVVPGANAYGQNPNEFMRQGGYTPEDIGANPALAWKMWYG